MTPTVHKDGGKIVLHAVTSCQLCDRKSLKWINLNTIYCRYTVLYLLSSVLNSHLTDTWNERNSLQDVLKVNYKKEQKTKSRQILLGIKAFIYIAIKCPPWVAERHEDTMYCWNKIGYNRYNSEGAFCWLIFSMWHICVSVPLVIMQFNFSAVMFSSVGCIKYVLEKVFTVIYQINTYQSWVTYPGSLCHMDYYV